MNRISPNFVDAFIFIRSRLGLLHTIFFLFVAEVYPSIYVRNLFLLNIFRTWPFYSLSFLQICTVLDNCQNFDSV